MERRRVTREFEVQAVKLVRDRGDFALGKLRAI